MTFYLVDKPKNFTSFDVLKYLRGKLKTSKIGHTGTLDPLATGALLIAIGKYTKLIPYFEKDKKEYEFSMNFDGKSDSFDLETEVFYISQKEQKKAEKQITKVKIENILKDKFTGNIKQIPPKYSAIKINGRKALNRVFDGEEFEMKERDCYIYEIELLSYNYPKASFRALVSAGTYIRSIANDLGSEFGTGAYITELKRTKVGNLDIKEAQDLENFDVEKNISVKKLFPNNIFIELDNETIKKIDFGMRIKGDYDFPIGKELFVYNDDKITNIVEYDGNILIPRKKL